MGEPEKGEGFRTPLAAPLPCSGRQKAELDQARLVLMERQAKLGQSFLEGLQHLLRIYLVLEAHDEGKTVCPLFG
jgi:hypothetical protein